MRISTTTGAWRDRRDGQYVPVNECIPRLAAAGFEAVDISFCHSIDQHIPLYKNGIEINDDNWEKWVDETNGVLKACGIPATQAHAPFYNVLSDNVPMRDYWEEMVRRSVIASGRMGIDWIVFHPGFLPDSCSDRLNLERNLEYLLPYLELAAEHGTGIAIENMLGPMSDQKSRGRRRFASGIDDLLELADRLAQRYDNVGICWDFGHANEMAMNQEECLRMIGNRLKCLHVNDNNGLLDDHILPFSGNIDWPALMKVLGEIRYDGDLAYECHKFTHRLPEELVDEALRFSVSVAEYLVSVIRENTLPEENGCL